MGFPGNPHTPDFNVEEITVHEFQPSVNEVLEVFYPGCPTLGSSQDDVEDGVCHTCPGEDRCEGKSDDSVPRCQFRGGRYGYRSIASSTSVCAEVLHLT